jgi:hypothetical protein
LDRNAIKITGINFTELHRLCDEFGFSELATKLSDFRPSINFKQGPAETETETETEDADTCGRIAALEEKTNQYSHVITILQDKVIQLSTDLRRL